MLKIAVCDDTPKERKQFVALMEAYLAANHLEAEVTAFAHPDALLTASEATPFDLYLLDVMMPMISGIGVGQELRRRHSKAQIVYLTTSEEYAVAAFSVKAAHYLLKPITAEAFNEAVDRAIGGMRRGSPAEMTIRSGDGALHTLDASDIEYIESSGHDQYIYAKGEVLVEKRRSIARLQEELDALAPGQFIAPYKGFLVNLRAIVTVETRSILLRGGDRIPIPRGSFRQLQAQYLAYRFTKKEGTL